MREYLKSKIYQARCKRNLLLNMVDKLTEEEVEALYRMLQNIEQDSEIRGQREASRKPWKFFR